MVFNVCRPREDELKQREQQESKKREIGKREQQAGPRADSHLLVARGSERETYCLSDKTLFSTTIVMTLRRL